MSDLVPLDLVAAIDIGGTNTVFALVSREGKIIIRDSMATNSIADFDEYVAVIMNRLNLMVGHHKILAVGIGAPNGNYFNGTIEFAPNLPWKGVLHLAKTFNKYSGLPAVVTNDANAAALGEKYFGSAKDLDDYIFITLGTGLGSGIVAGGKLIYGHDGFAGEIGHTIIFQDGRPCGCGRKGCLEQYCSATGIVKTYLEILRKQGQILNVDNVVTAKSIFDLAVQGDIAALQSFESTGDILGFALANSVAYTSPKAIFLFGGLANAGKFIFKPVIESFEKNLLTIYKNKIKILPSGLPENDAALLGAASIAWEGLNLN